MDAIYIEKVSEELNQIFSKKKITKYDHNRNSFTIEIENRCLIFLLENPNGIILKSGKVQNKTFLKKFRNLFIKSVNTLNNDRIILFNLVKLSISGKKETFNLIIELTGKHSNIIITDSQRKILYTFKEVVSSVRNIALGEIYTLPPNDKKELEELKFGQITVEGIEKKLFKYVKGLSPLNCKEIAFYVRKGLPLKEAYQKFFTNHKTSKSAFIFYEKEKPKFLTTFKYESLIHLPHKEFPSFIEAWQTFIEKIYTEAKVNTTKSKLLKYTERQLKTIEEKLKKFENPEYLLKEAEKLKKAGELLKYHLPNIKPGQDIIVLKDFETGKEISITIDPSKTPKENLNQIFKKSRKLKSKAEFEKIEKERLLSQKEFFNKLREKINQTESLTELQEIEKIFYRERKEKKEKKIEFPFKLTLPSGKQILIGRNRIENEIVSLKLSNPWDLWFHTKEIPGSHVILKLDKGEEPDEEDIELAASAAVFYSKGKNSGKVKVDYTRAKNLKKPPKTPPGYITYRDEKTVVTDSRAFESFLKGNNLFRE